VVTEPRTMEGRADDQLAHVALRGQSLESSHGVGGVVVAAADRHGGQSIEAVRADPGAWHRTAPQSLPILEQGQGRPAVGASDSAIPRTASTAAIWSGAPEPPRILAWVSTAAARNDTDALLGGERRLRPGLIAAGGRSPVLYGLRRGRVRFVAVADRRLRTRTRELRRMLLRVGLR
jgi:hypothetical protein